MSALYAIGDFVGIVDQSRLTVPMPNWWYMLRVHPSYGMKVERQLNARGVSSYCPKEQMVKRIGWGKYDRRQMPVFPGSLFIPDFEANLPKLRSIADGIGGFVRMGAEPLRISLLWMDRIRLFETKLAENPNKRKFEVDQRIRIVGGPFDMWEGKIERLDSRYRLSVLIDILGSSSSLQLDEEQVEAV